MAEQLSVFVQNEPGKLALITRALSDGGVDIRALSIADTKDFGILRMLVSDADKARRALSGINCTFSATPIVVVAVPDVPGGLAAVLELMAKAGVDIEYMYSLIGRGEEKAFMVFRVSDEKSLVSLLADNGISTVSSEELGIR